MSYTIESITQETTTSRKGYKITKASLKEVDVKSILSMISNGLNEDALNLTINEWKTVADYNGDEKLTDKEIAKWIQRNLNEEGKKTLPVLLKSNILFDIFSFFVLKNTDRKDSIEKAQKHLAFVGGDCQLKTIFGIANVLLNK